MKRALEIPKCAQCDGDAKLRETVNGIEIYSATGDKIEVIAKYFCSSGHQEDYYNNERRVGEDELTHRRRQYYLKTLGPLMDKYKLLINDIKSELVGDIRRFLLNRVIDIEIESLVLPSMTYIRGLLVTIGPGETIIISKIDENDYVLYRDIAKGTNIEVKIEGVLAVYNNDPDFPSNFNPSNTGFVIHTVEGIITCKYRRNKNAPLKDGEFTVGHHIICRRHLLENIIHVLPINSEWVIILKNNSTYDMLEINTHTTDDTLQYGGELLDLEDDKPKSIVKFNNGNSGYITTNNILFSYNFIGQTNRERLHANVFKPVIAIRYSPERTVKLNPSSHINTKNNFVIPLDAHTRNITNVFRAYWYARLFIIKTDYTLHITNGPVNSPQGYNYEFQQILDDVLEIYPRLIPGSRDFIIKKINGDIWIGTIESGFKKMSFLLRLESDEREPKRFECHYCSGDALFKTCLTSKPLYLCSNQCFSFVK